MDEVKDLLHIEAADDNSVDEFEDTDEEEKETDEEEDDEEEEEAPADSPVEEETL